MNKGNLNLFIWFRLVTNRGKNGKLPIYLRFSISKKRVELSTNLFVDPKLWDSEGQFVKGKTEEAQTINRRLALIKGELHKKYLQLEALGHNRRDLKKPVLGC
jgi:hypothetical protein